MPCAADEGPAPRKAAPGHHTTKTHLHTNPPNTPRPHTPYEAVVDHTHACYSRAGHQQPWRTKPPLVWREGGRRARLHALPPRCAPPEPTQLCGSSTRAHPVLQLLHQGPPGSAAPPGSPPQCVQQSDSVTCTHSKLLSCVRFFVTPCTVAHQAPLFMDFYRKEHWSGLPFPSPGDLSNPGIELESLMSPTLAGRLFTTSTTWEAHYM